MDTRTRFRTKAGGNVFLDLGFSSKEAKRLLAEADAGHVGVDWHASALCRSVSLRYLGQGARDDGGNSPESPWGRH